MSENPNPIQEAQKARKRIHNAVETNTPAKLEIPPQIAACILGLPKNILKNMVFLL